MRGPPGDGHRAVRITLSETLPTESVMIKLAVTVRRKTGMVVEPLWTWAVPVIAIGLLIVALVVGVGIVVTRLCVAGP